MEEEDEEDVAKAGNSAEASAKKKNKRKKKKKGKEQDGADVVQLPTVEESHAEGEAEHADTEVDAWGNDVPEEWVDITFDCELAVKGMHVGEMIESPQFRLFDAMSAIEIMDPKMDSGYKNSEDMTLEQAVDSGVIMPSLKYSELVAIWEQMLMYYLLWLEGHTIVQTFFSCLYLHDLQTYVKPIPLFGAFVDAFLVACRQARSAVLRAGVFDDEDFLPSMFGIDLDMSVYSTVPKECRERIDKECKALKGDKSPAALAVKHRLEFIGEYMLALKEFENDAPDGKSTTQVAKRRLTACLNLIEKLGASANVAAPDALKCFDASINRKLLVPGPPRTVAPIADSNVVSSMWTSHIQELLLCCSLSSKPLAPLLEGAITYKDEPNVLPRSVAELSVTEQGFLRNLMIESLELFLFPRDALQHCKRTVVAFLDHSEQIFANLLRLTYSNRARRFRRLAHVFSDFNALQHRAWSLDEELKTTFGANMRYNRPCWVWIMEHCLQMMLAKLFLGFELDLYDEAEFHMIYWYADYIYGLRVYNLNELHYFKEQPVGGEKKKGTRSRQAQQQAAGRQRPRNPPPFLLLLEATQCSVRGLFRLLAFCLREDLISSPEAVREGLAQRFVLRFRSLELFQLPHLPSFNNFQQSSASAQAPVESRVVLEAAQASFSEAAQLLDRLGKERDAGSDVSPDSAKALRRVVVANQLAITQLLQRLATGKRSKAVVALSHHPHFVSVQVQSGD